MASEELWTKEFHEPRAKADMKRKYSTRHLTDHNPKKPTGTSEGWVCFYVSWRSTTCGWPAGDVNSGGVAACGGQSLAAMRAEKCCDSVCVLVSTHHLATAPSQWHAACTPAWLTPDGRKGHPLGLFKRIQKRVLPRPHREPARPQDWFARQRPMTDSTGQKKRYWTITKKKKQRYKKQIRYESSKRTEIKRGTKEKRQTLE